MTFRQRGVLHLVLVLAPLLPTPILAAPPPPCSDLKPDSGNTGYRIRESNKRCEGFYISLVSAARGLELVGLMQGRLVFDSTKDRELLLTAPVTDQPVHVRGVGIPEKTYYRLDGLIPGGGTFRWSLSDVVQPRGLRAGDIGLFGFLENASETYVPVKAGTGQTIAWIRGSEPFAHVQWRHADAHDGSCGKMSSWQNLTPPRGVGKPMEIPLPDSSGSGICLEVAAQPTVGTDWHRGLWRIKTGI